MKTHEIGVKDDITVGSLVRFTLAWLQSGNLGRAELKRAAARLGTVTGCARVGHMTALTVIWGNSKKERLVNADIVEVVWNE